jgi:hypothetical protein
MFDVFELSLSLGLVLVAVGALVFGCSERRIANIVLFLFGLFFSNPKPKKGQISVAVPIGRWCFNVPKENGLQKKKREKHIHHRT